MGRTILALLILAGAAARTMAARAAPLCFPAYQVDHTEVPDDHAIYFIMRDHAHTIYRAAIDGSCTGLSMDTRGFTYEPTDPGSDQICSNLLTIRLNTYKSFCIVGAIEKVSSVPRR